MHGFQRKTRTPGEKNDFIECVANCEYDDWKAKQTHVIDLE